MFIWIHQFPNDANYSKEHVIKKFSHLSKNNFCEIKRSSQGGCLIHDIFNHKVCGATTTLACQYTHFLRDLRNNI